jgi:F-type H+-transporting ATPase subunit b
MRKYTKHYVLVLTLLAMVMFAPAALATEASGPAGALGINAGLLLAQTVNFIVVAVLLYFLLIGPLGRMLDSRTEKIKKGLADANEAANARRNAEADAEKILAEARAEAQKIVADGRARGDELAGTIRTEAQAEGEKIRSDAQAAAEQARDAELANLRNQVGAISIALANRLIGESLTEKKQKALISDFFAKVPEGALNLGGDVTVVSAMPLENAEKTKIEKELKADNVSYSVDPNILGGLVIRSSDSVVDGSVRSGLNDLSARIQ